MKEIALAERDALIASGLIGKMAFMAMISISGFLPIAIAFFFKMGLF